MIQNTPTFQYQLYECFRGQPGNKDSRLSIPYLDKAGRRIRATYKNKAYLPNPVFPIELYEYRRDNQIQLSVEGKVESKFAENNLGREVYKNEDMKYIRSALIDMCRQNMDSQFERELDDEIRLLNSTDDEFDGKSLEYHYDLYETVKTFNDYLCIVYLNLANILTYPNETFYEKYEKKQIRIKPDDALKMANKVCQSMQKQFEDIIIENFPIKETVERITKVEKNMPSFDTDEIVETKKKTTKVTKKKVIRELD